MEKEIRYGQWVVALMTLATLAMIAATLWWLPGLIDSVTRPAAWLTGIVWGVLASGWLAGSMVMAVKWHNLIKSRWEAEEREKQEVREKERCLAARERAETARQSINQEFMTTTFVKMLEQTRKKTTTHFAEVKNGEKQPAKKVVKEKPLDSHSLLALIQCYHEFINSKPA